MLKREGNGQKQAFPGGEQSSGRGFSKREEMARSAMQGLLSRKILNGSDIGVCKEGFVDPRTIADFAVKYADALLERIKEIDDST